MSATSGSLSAFASVFVPGQGAAPPAQEPASTGSTPLSSGGRTSLRTALSSKGSSFVPRSSNWAPAPAAQTSQGYWPGQAAQFQQPPTASFAQCQVGRPDEQAAAGALATSPMLAAPMFGGNPQPQAKSWNTGAAEFVPSFNLESTGSSPGGLGMVPEASAISEPAHKSQAKSRAFTQCSTEADDEFGDHNSEDTPSTQATHEQFSQNERSSDDDDQEWDCDEQQGGGSSSTSTVQYRPRSDVSATSAADSTDLSVQALLRWRVAALRQPLPRSQVDCCVAATERTNKPRTDSKADKAEQAAKRETRSPAATFQASPTSWAAQRRSPAAEKDAEVVKNIRSVLNKLTVERFEANYQKLIDIGIGSNQHIEVLMREVFEKATEQHHFIPMYADLCSRLNEWFVETQGAENGKVFKRILLNRCQLSFEQTLKPSSLPALAQLSPEEREEAEIKHKTRTLGNLKLVGALLEKGMLASRILLAVVDELRGEPTSAALECLSVFLTAVGPTFDRPEWVHHPALCETFETVDKHRQRDDIPSRTRCLLQDLLDLRASKWQNLKKAVRKEAAPTTLDDVYKRAKEEAKANQESWASRRPQGGAARSASNCASNAWSATPTPTATQTSPSHRQPQRRATFNGDTFNEEVSKVLSKLARGGSGNEAFDTLSLFSPPHDQQATLITIILAQVSEGRNSAGRRAGFKLVAELFSSGLWQRTALSDALTQFFGDTFDELKLDIPKLPQIVAEDMMPEMKALVESGILEKRWLPACGGAK